MADIRAHTSKKKSDLLPNSTLANSISVLQRLKHKNLPSQEQPGEKRSKQRRFPMFPPSFHFPLLSAFLPNLRAFMQVSAEEAPRLEYEKRVFSLGHRVGDVDDVAPPVSAISALLSESHLCIWGYNIVKKQFLDVHRQHQAGTLHLAIP
eukprot:2588999-Amphidinium_carterae.1